METNSALLAICAGNSPVPGEFPAQRPVTRSFDVFFDLRLNKRLSKQPWGWWFETPSCRLWRHCNDSNVLYNMRLYLETHQYRILFKVAHSLELSIKCGLLDFRWQFRWQSNWSKAEVSIECGLRVTGSVCDNTSDSPSYQVLIFCMRRMYDISIFKSLLPEQTFHRRNFKMHILESFDIVIPNSLWSSWQ